MLHDLNDDFIKGKSAYPKTVEGAVRLLVDYGDRTQKTRKKKDDEPELSFAQVYRCFCCGSTSHKADKCQKRKTTDRKEWWINNVGKDDSKEEPKKDNESKGEKENSHLAWHG